MMYLQSTAVITSLVAATVLFLPGAQSSPYVISDDRVRDLDITPVLGKGYSIMTNSFQSTCLLVDEVTVPSYNYDYSFYDFTGSAATMDIDMASDFSYSFGYWWLKAKVASDKKKNLEIPNRYIASSMRIERYYASVREEVSPLSADATTILNNGDYVGFFKACGPAYVRSIRRAQEVVAFIVFSSGNAENTAKFASNLQVNQWNPNQGKNQVAENNSMNIVIQGYGLGLRQDGSEALVANTLSEYNKVMLFAFKQLTVLEGDAIHIGMVYGMEVVPWVHNVAFQIQTNLLDEAIEIPLIQSVIPRSFKTSDPTIRTFDETARNEFRCKEITFVIDRYGYCCDVASLYNFATSTYEPGTLSERICRPMGQLDPAFVKDNMASNGEFVARLDSSVRERMNQLSLLERCIGAARAIPDRYNYYILEGQDKVKFDGAVEIKFTLFELKMAIDPFSDHGMLYHMAKELDEFLDRFIQPCYAALFGSNIGTSPNTEGSYFMAYPWHSHNECTKLSCLGSGMRWDRSSPKGGCVPSMISGPSAPNYDELGTGDKKCKQEIKNGELVCKDETTKLAEHFAKTAKVWSEVVSGGRVDYFLRTFCLPSLSGEILDPQAQYAMREAHLKSLGIPVTEKKPLNIALNKPTKQSSTAIPYKSSLAVDGETDGVWHRNSGTHTRSGGETDPWWEVDLEDEFEISKIKIYNRQDCCSAEIEGFTIQIFKGDNPRHIDQAFERNMEDYTVGDYLIEYTPSIGVIGDRVRITIPGDQKTLSLMEVEVITMFEANFLRGTILEFGESLYSDNKLFKLANQKDGNLVIYDVKGGRAIWATNTNEVNANNKLELDSNGILNLQGQNTMRRWTAEPYTNDITMGDDAYVVLTNKGELHVMQPGLLLNDDHQVAWETGYYGFYYFKNIQWQNYVSVSSGGFVSMRQSNRGNGVPGNYETFVLEKVDGDEDYYRIKSASRKDANEQLNTYLTVDGRGSMVAVKSTWNKHLATTNFMIEFLGDSKLGIKSATYKNYFRSESGPEGRLNTQTGLYSWEKYELIEASAVSFDVNIYPFVHGENWSPRHKLGLCEGDCDRNSDCGTFKGTQLFCWHRSDRRTVPGCQGGEVSKSYMDYCVEQQFCNGNCRW